MSSLTEGGAPQFGGKVKLHAPEMATLKLPDDPVAFKAFMHDWPQYRAQLEKLKGVSKEWVSARVSAVSSGVTIAESSDKRQEVDQLEMDFR